MLESRISLRQLRYFVDVVEQRGFTAAARVLHVAQPALSRQIAQLEDDLGERLLLRQSDGVLPTDAGLRLYDLARAVLERVNGAREDVRGQPSEPQGRVSVALPTTGGTDLITELVQVCAGELPKVALQVIDGVSTQTGHVLESGMVDFGVVPNADEVPGIEAEPLFHEHLFLVRRAAGSGVQPVDIAFADAVALPLVLGPRSMHLRRYLEQQAGTAGLALTVAHEQRSANTIAGFVRAGLGATVTNWPSMREFFPEGHVIAQRIVQPDLRRTIAIGHAAARPLNRAARATFDVLRRLLLDRVHDGRWRGEAIDPAR
ncbi:MAG: LysR family transcriptional regulator [Proteobacteria bacterium]|nr:LysR family transcriptional regulator [Pseudomonadota bacterium]